MKKMSDRLIVTLALTLLFLINCVAVADQSESELVDKIRNCAAIDGRKERYSCYDLIAENLDSSLTSAKNNNTSNEIPTASTKTLPSTLGGRKFDKANQKSPVSIGTVVSCKRTSDNRWFFIFESGQVWKQTDRKKRFFKDCNFNVTVQYDGLGYVMRIESKKSRIRIKRTR